MKKNPAIVQRERDLRIERRSNKIERSVQIHAERRIFSRHNLVRTFA